MKIGKSKIDYLLNQSKTFCMAPWITIHTKPVGDAMPCCISNPDFVVGSSHKHDLMQIVNSPLMNDLRLNMLSEQESRPCISCYKHEDQGIGSFRTTLNKEYGQYLADGLKSTQTDGSLSEFKMRYFDVRFDNICNFKCRTCSAEYSSQWEQENKKQNITINFEKGVVNPNFIQDVLSQVKHLQCVNFAGGEPLITEEHYLVLEELLKQKNYDTELRYYTNLSNLKFKDKNILELWKQFSKPIQLYASIDHYGDRANYIRHGTIKWDSVENNLITLTKLDYVELHIQTVLSIFNCLTLNDFYAYLREIGVHEAGNYNLSHPIFMMHSPRYLSSQILPKKFKDIAISRIKNLCAYMEENQFSSNCIPKLNEIENWIYAFDLWHKQKTKFRQEIKRIDSIRNEDFITTFPELEELMYETKQNIFTTTK